MHIRLTLKKESDSLIPVALLYISMQTPATMGADRHNELENMKRSRNTPEFSFDVIAIDENGEELYETDAADTEREAEQIVSELNDMEPPEGVHSFHYKERE